jgi:predicted RNase H-like HicB family nuclease
MSQSNIADRYLYRVIWSEEDGEYVGLCAELPSLSWLDKSRVAALTGIAEVVQHAVNDMLKNNEEIPAPLARG